MYLMQEDAERVPFQYSETWTPVQDKREISAPPFK